MINNQNLLIIGFGGHSNVVEEIANLSQQYNRISFLDDNPKLQNFSNKREYLGKVENIYKNEIKNNFHYAFVAIGNCSIRLKLHKLIKKNNYKIPILIHPNSYISRSCKIGDGTLVAPNSVVNTNSVVGESVILNTSSTIDHDCIIEDGVHICPGVNIAGGVKIGSCYFIGIVSQIIQNLTLGDNVKIGAGSTVLNSFSSQKTIAGSPAKDLKK